MSSSRRNALRELSKEQAEHAGLWLDRFIKSTERADVDSQRALVAETSSIGEPASYEAYYRRWEGALAEGGALTRTARVLERMVIGLGAESVLETSITLHRTYGVPLIPGSALKGLCAHYTNNRLDEKWQKGSPAYEILFGSTESAGYITFYDALYCPGSGFKGRPLHADILTVHHSDYYQGTGNPPADWDNPIPVPFLTATGKYLIALGGPEIWVETAFKILKHALEEEGIGAKTSSGYGRLELEEPLVDPELQKVEDLIQSLASIPKDRAASELPRYYEHWKAFEGEEKLKKRLAQAIVDTARRTNREKDLLKRQKGWYLELLASLGE